MRKGGEGSEGARLCVSRVASRRAGRPVYIDTDVSIRSSWPASPSPPPPSARLRSPEEARLVPARPQSAHQGSSSLTL